MNGNSEEFLTNGPNFKLAPILPSDLGTYKCIATNTYGKSESLLTIGSSAPNGSHYDSLIYAYISQDFNNKSTKITHLRKNYLNHHDEEEILAVKHFGNFNVNESITLICHTGSIF